MIETDLAIPHFRGQGETTLQAREPPDPGRIFHGGGEARRERNTKRAGRDERMRDPMHPGQRHGLDHMPLFRFLHTRAGQDRNAVRVERAFDGALLDWPWPCLG